MTKNTQSTPIMLDRLEKSLGKFGVSLKRTQLLQVAAASFGYANTHQFTAADKKGEFAIPPANYQGHQEIEGIGGMDVFMEEDGSCFMMMSHLVDDAATRSEKWIAGPSGQLYDLEGCKEAISKRQAEQERAGPQYAHAEETRTLSWEDDESVIYLTNGCCENVHDDAEKILKGYGLEGGSFEGEFYPLTERESAYIAEDLVTSLDGRMHALTGYSAIYRGQKYVMPSIELPVGEVNDAGSHDEVRGKAAQYRKNILAKVKQMNGHILLDTGIDDCVVIQILVPFEETERFGSLEEWHKHLAWLMVDPTFPGAVKDGKAIIFAHEGKHYRISCEWIGEGLDYEYDPTDPHDIPLIRFDADRKVIDENGNWTSEWEEIPDGSYCTQVPAYAPLDILEALPRYLVAQMEASAGSSMKRLLERLSWVTEENIREYLAIQSQGNKV